MSAMHEYFIRKRHPLIPEIITEEGPVRVWFRCSICKAEAEFPTELVEAATAHVISHEHGGPI